MYQNSAEAVAIRTHSTHFLNSEANEAVGEAVGEAASLSGSGSEAGEAIKVPSGQVFY